MVPIKTLVSEFSKFIESFSTKAFTSPMIDALEYFFMQMSPFANILNQCYYSFSKNKNMRFKCEMYPNMK